MKKSLKIKLAVVTIIVLAAAGYATYMCVNYFFYDEYRKYLTGYTYEEGREFTALKDSDPRVKGMVLAAENDILKLYTDTATTEVAVYDKRTGEVTYSNPVDRAADPIANGRNKIDLNSQFVLTYYDINMTLVTMYNYDYSVERGQYTYEGIDNGIRYTYMCGNFNSPTGLVPVYITRERLEEKILSRLTDKEAKSISKNYIESKDLPGFLELTKGSQSNKVGLEKIQKLIEQAGYTQEDFDADAAAAAGGKVVERTSFTVPLEYRLEGDKLVVTIPADKIVETGSGRLSNIDLLSYFGAGGTGEEGYIFVPNGSGSLIYFNNGKKSERYNQYVYGMDELSQTYTVVEDLEKARLPVFGIKRDNSAVFAEVTSGDALSNIIAQVSGDTNSYNYVHSSFMLRGSEIVSMFGVTGSSADLPTLEKDIYDLDLTVSYSFLEKEAASYSGMAGYYRNELISRGELVRKEEESSIPFYLDIVGGVKMQQSILGIPYLSVYAMTTFDEAGKIADSLMKGGISNLRVNYLGWFNGGYYHDVPKQVKVERKLGGRKDLKALNNKLNEAGAVLYGDVAFQRVSWESDHFNYKLESSLWYSGYPVFFGRVNPATLTQTSSLGYYEIMFNILSPKYLVRYVDKFRKAMDKVDVSGISLRDLGDVLASDRKRTNIINRQEAKQIVLGQFTALDQEFGHLMVNGGNSYTWAYASDLTNVPSGHNPFYIVDEEVPFYQMVIHGYIDYTSGAINLSDSYDKQQIVLRMIEFAAAPHFTFSWEESSKIKYSAMNSFYSTQYLTWMDDAEEIYQRTNEVLKKVVNSAVAEHVILGDGIRKITYDNGVVIYINYNDTGVTAENISIPAKSYVMGGAE